MISIGQLRAQHTFAGWRDAELQALLGCGLERAFAAGENLCALGAVAREFFLVLSGRVDVIKETARGERCLQSAVGGEIVGQRAMIGRVRRTSVLRARERTTVLVIERESYQRLIDACSPLAMRFQRLLAVAAARGYRAAVGGLFDAFERGELQGIPGFVPSANDPPAVPARPRAQAHDVEAYIARTASSMNLPIQALDEMSYGPQQPQRRRTESR